MDSLHESKSLETLKSLLDQTPIPNGHKMRRNRAYYEFEDDENNFNSENDEENNENNANTSVNSQRLTISLSEERILSNSSSLVNLSSIQNPKMTCSATNANNSTSMQTKSSSSSSSSKNGSNKNSLHGSIETMIEVS